jgi:adenylate cyclase
MSLPLPPGERFVTVTPHAFAFSDIVDSTGLAARLGDFRFATLIREHNRRLRSLLPDEGAEAQFLGDGFMVAFQSGQAGLDWAVGAQREVAAIAARRGVALRIRVGVHAGVAVREGGSYVGRDVIVARRLCEHAGPGEILVSERVRELAGLTGGASRAVELKGFRCSAPAWPLGWGA